MNYYGDFTPGKTMRLWFNTSDAIGAPITLGGSAAARAYKDAGTTESSAGITVTVDFDGRTGLHLIEVDTSADGTFYSAGADIAIMLTVGTVSGQSIAGLHVGSFSLSNRSALRPTTADRTLDVSATGEAGLDWANIGSPTTAQGLTGTTISVSQVIASVSGAVGSVTGAVASVTAAVTVGTINAGVITATAIADGALTAAKFAAGAFDAVWSVATRTLTTVADSAGVTTLLGKLAGITLLAEWLGLIAGKQAGNATARTELRATGAGSGTFDETTDSQEALRDRGDAAWTTATGFSTHSAADVWAVGTRTLTAFDAAFKTGYALSSAGVQAIWDALTSALTTVGSIGKLIVDNLDAAISSRLASASYTTPPTVGAIADQVWDETLADHLGAGSTGAGLNAAGSAGDPWATAIPGAYGAGTAGKVVGDNLNATISSRATPAQVATELATYDGPTKAELDAAVAPLALEATAQSVLTDTAALDLRVPSDPADQSLVIAATDAVMTRLGVPAVSVSADIATRASQTSVDDVPTNAELATALGTADDAVLAAIAALDALLTGARAEPGQGAPAVNASALAKIDYVYKAWRNKHTQTATTYALYNDAGTVVDQKATVSDDGTVFTREEAVSGP